MDDRPARKPAPEPTRDDDPDVSRRPIPDGGLGAAMPAWLQQPPVWKQPPIQATSRTLPEPDTSAIDLSTMLDDDDLPQWLRDMAVSAPVTRSKDAPADAPTIVTTWPGPAHAQPAAESPMRARDDGATSPSWSEPNIQAALDYTPFRPEPATPPWWMSNVAIGVLFGAIVVTLVYVILVASGVW
jgi:hypothetical protein